MQLCLGYSWFSDQLYVGEKMLGHVSVGRAPSPKANFVKFKEWLSVTEKGRDGRGPSQLSPNPFILFGGASVQVEEAHACSGG